MEYLHVYGVINSDEELKKLLTDNFVVVFLDDREINDNIIFEPLKYITLYNYDKDYIRVVVTDPYIDMNIQEIVDVLDKKEDFDLENFGERHEIVVEPDYPLYFYAIYKENKEDFKNVVTYLKNNNIRVISAKIIKYIEETVS